MSKKRKNVKSLFENAILEGNPKYRLSHLDTIKCQ